MKAWKTKIELLEMKNVMFELKNMLDGINNRVDTVEEKISKLEDIEMETIKNKTEKKNFKNEQRISFDRSNIYAIVVPKREGKGREENIFEKIMGENFQI